MDLSSKGPLYYYTPNSLLLLSGKSTWRFISTDTMQVLEKQALQFVWSFMFLFYFEAIRPKQQLATIQHSCGILYTGVVFISSLGNNKHVKTLHTPCETFTLNLLCNQHKRQPPKWAPKQIYVNHTLSIFVLVVEMDLNRPFLLHVRTYVYWCENLIEQCFHACQFEM